MNKFPEAAEVAKHKYFHGLHGMRVWVILQRKIDLPFYWENFY